MEESPKFTYWKTVAAGWISFLLGILVLLAGLGTGEWLMGLAGAGLAIVGLCALIVIRRRYKEIPLYRPGKGFRYYRLPPKRKNQVMTACQILVVILIIGGFTLWEASGHATGAAIGGLIVIQFLKSMNKRAVPLADSDAFELEDLGVVPPGEYVVGIYKDFLHWDDVREGSRILLLTPERLIAIRMISPEQGERTEFRWTEINRLSFMHQGKQGLGLVISIGLTTGEIVRFMLRGPGVKYSRDQFVQTLLETMDKRLGGRDSDRAGTSAPIRPAGYASQFRNRPSFRSAALFHAANGSRVVDF